jgi:hypothetical protein
MFWKFLATGKFVVSMSCQIAPERAEGGYSENLLKNHEFCGSLPLIAPKKPHSVHYLPKIVFFALFGVFYAIYCHCFSQKSHCHTPTVL